eukprot:1158422-Pelagomonas_calceolata.AAC.6
MEMASRQALEEKNTTKEDMLPACNKCCLSLANETYAMHINSTNNPSIMLPLEAIDGCSALFIIKQPPYE